MNFATIAESCTVVTQGARSCRIGRTQLFSEWSDNTSPGSSVQNHKAWEFIQLFPDFQAIRKFTVAFLDQNLPRCLIHNASGFDLPLALTAAELRAAHLVFSVCLPKTQILICPRQWYRVGKFERTQITVRLKPYVFLRASVCEFVGVFKDNKAEIPRRRPTTLQTRKQEQNTKIPKVTGHSRKFSQA